jgi:hypothetical protein
LVASLSALDDAVPDVAKLARELQAWCDREAAQRMRGGGGGGGGGFATAR